MPSPARLLFASLILTFMILFPAASEANGQAPDAKSKGTGSISGRVTIGDKGAPGIMVVVTPGGFNRESPVGQGTTDADGNYRISKVPSGQFAVLPVAPLFVIPRDSSSSMGGKTLILSEGETVEGIDFKLTRGGVITGRITDADNRPVIEEHVVLTPVDDKGAPARIQMFLPSNYQMYQTDDRGVYRIYGLPAARYTISVGDDANSVSFGRRGGSYQRTYHPDVTDPIKATVVEIGEGTEATAVDIKLGQRAPTYTATGRIVDANSGQPITGVSVGLGIVRNNGGQDYIGGTTGSAPTNARGEFKLAGLAPGRYATAIEDFSGDKGTGIYSDPVSFEIVDSDISNLEVKAIRGSSLSGVVVFEGEPSKETLAKLSRLSIYASVAKPSGLQMQSGAGSTIDASGSFRINGLRPGKALLHIYGREPQSIRGYPITRIERDGVRQDQGLEIQAGEDTTGVRVVVAFGTSVIRGQVKIEGGSMPPGTQLRVGITRDGMQLDRDVPVDTRGTFIVDALPAGTYELTLFGNVFGPPKRGERRPLPLKQIVTVGAGSEVEVGFTLDLGERKDTP